MDKRLKALIKTAEAQGWVVVVGKHVKFLSPSGGMVIASKTPSDVRSLKNTIGHLRRAGLKGV